MPVGAFRPEGDHHLRPLAAQHAHDVAQEALANRLDFFDSLERAIRVIKDFKKVNAELGGGVAEFERANVGQRAKIAGRPTIPEPGATSRHGDQADGRPLGAVARDGGGASETLVVRVRHHHHQALAVTLHAPTIMNVS